MNIQSRNPILQPHISSFKSSGKLEGDAQRQEIPAQSVPDFKAQLTAQMDQVIAADNTPQDKDPAIGKVWQEEPDFGLSVKADFEGNTSEGKVSMDVHTLGIESSAYAEFTKTGALVIQSMSTGGEPGFVGVHLDYNGGQSYIETLNVPDGVGVGL